MDADLDQFLFLAAVGLILFDARKDLFELVADVHRNDCGRRLAGAQPVIVRRGGDGEPQHILIIVHRLQHRTEEQQELGVLIRRVARLEQIDAGVRHDRPVVMLAAAVDAGKRLFVQQTDHVVLARDLLHQLHRQLVVVCGDICRRKDRRQLVLSGGDLVMLGFCHDAKLPKLVIQLLHKGGDARLDRAEIVVVKLLPLRRHRAEECPAGIAEVAALFVYAPINEEVFLFGTDSRLDIGHVLIAEQAQHAHRLTVERLHRAKQRRFLVQRLSPIGAEGRRDAEHAVLDKGIRRRIPCGVAPRLKGSAQPA